MEFEYVALVATGKEAKWLRDLKFEILKISVDVSTISIHCDNQVTLIKAYNNIYNGKSRHISLRHDFMRELIDKSVISILYVKSCENLVEPYTKHLGRDLVSSTNRGMGLKLLDQ